MQSCASYQPETPHGQSILASVLLHGVLFYALFSIVPSSFEAPEEEQRIKVDIISLKSLEAMRPKSQLPAPSDVAPTPALPPAQAQDPQKDPSALIRPGKMRAAGVLAQKSNAQARQDLAGITDDERIEQLCAMEALEQIQAWNSNYKPERMVSYTFAEVIYEGTRLIANGAVFWSKNNWHRMKYECDLSSDFKSVIDFAFLVGVIVPKDRWADYNLTKYK